MKSKFRHVARWTMLALGGVFVWSAVAKLRALEQFGMIIEAHGVLPTALVPFVSISVAFVEAVCGLLLLGGRWFRLQTMSIACTAALLTTLTLYLLLVWWLGHPRTDCGCFGPFAGMKVSYAILRNALLLVVVCVAAWILGDPMAEPH